jgi:hypothetical protein
MHALLSNCTCIHGDALDTPPHHENHDMVRVIRDLLTCHKTVGKGTDNDTFHVVLASKWMRCAARNETYYDMVYQTAESLLSSPSFHWTVKHLVINLELPFHETFEHTMHDLNLNAVNFASDLEMEEWMRQWMKSHARRLLPCPTTKHVIRVPSCASDNMADIMTLSDSIMDVLTKTFYGVT